jgi:hypothetical protein
MTKALGVWCASIVKLRETHRSQGHTLLTPECLLDCACSTMQSAFCPASCRRHEKLTASAYTLLTATNL